MNITQQHAYYYTSTPFEQLPANALFQGSQAEWIMERTCISSCLSSGPLSTATSPIVLSDLSIPATLTSSHRRFLVPAAAHWNRQHTGRVLCVHMNSGTACLGGGIPSFRDGMKRPGTRQNSFRAITVLDGFLRP